VLLVSVENMKNAKLDMEAKMKKEILPSAVVVVYVDVEEEA